MGRLGGEGMLLEGGEEEMEEERKGGRKGGGDNIETKGKILLFTKVL